MGTGTGTELLRAGTETTKQLTTTTGKTGTEQRQQQQQQKYNDPSQDRLSEAHRKVADVKSIMIENIEKVLQRAEKMEILVDRVRESVM